MVESEGSIWVEFAPSLCEKVGLVVKLKATSFQFVKEFCDSGGVLRAHAFEHEIELQCPPRLIAVTDEVLSHFVDESSVRS